MLLLAAICLAGCQHSPKATVAPPVRVEVLPVQPASGHGAMPALSGTVEAATRSTVSFNVPGTITEITVEQGQRVAKGQTLARIRSGNYVNADNIAEAELAQARDAYARLKKLHDADALPEIKWVEVQQKLKQAENAAELSARAVADATLQSPVDGVVSLRLAEPGQTVVTAEPVLELVSAADLRIAVSVPEAEIGRVAQGQDAVVSFPELGIDSLPGRVVLKSVVADPLTRAYTVKVSLPATAGRVLPGMVGNVTLTSAAAADEGTAGVVLPSQAVLLGADNSTFVWVVKDGAAARRTVTADELLSGGTLVTAGLQPGDSVIVAGMEKVGSGTRVTALTQSSH